MNRQQRVAALAACAAVCAAAPGVALAWGDDGHRIVGLIAKHYLDPAVLAQVDSILSGDNTGLVSPLDMAHEATWADKYRDSDRNTTQVRYNQTHLWHYVDLEIDGPNLDTACNHHPPVPTGTPASAAEANDCVVDKIEQFAAELANATTSATERRLALQFLLHFVGDLHQPLHSSDDNDSGGNAKKVHGVASASNLHSAWDTPFVTELGSDDDAIASALLAKITPALVTQWSQGAAADWAQEAFQLAKTEAYGRLPAPGADGSYTLDSNYVQNAQQVVQQQLSRAGVRLAWLLNRAIAPSPSPSPTPTPSPQQLVGNPGFEGTDAAPWTATPWVISDDPAEPPHSGERAAWLNGYGTTSTDRLSQSVTLPSGITAASLSFWLHIDTAETTKTKVYDKLTVQLLRANGSVLKTLGTFSNLNAASGYKRVTYNLSAFKGQTVTIRFTGAEDNDKQTSFVVDDVSLDIQ